MQSEVKSLAILAHDLKAPLCLMRQLAFAMNDANSPAERAEISSDMIITSDKALKQVNDLLKLARLDDGLFEMEPVGIRGICEDIYSELTPMFKQECRRLELNYSNRARLVTSNRELLKSVIYNFCTNALHYSEEDSASELSVADFRGFVRVKVRDFGPALPPAVWREIKNGGLSRPVSIAMRPGSSGLGLYIASEFSRHLHAKLGTIRHRDGTSFFIDLPVSYQASLF